MLNFEKPTYKISEYVENNNYGKFELEPLERGFGLTIGNALRRVMLSSLPGSAIIAVKAEGAMHEFQTIDGVAEDLTTIILNLKNVAIRNHTSEQKVIKLNVNKEGPVTAGDIVCDADVEIINKDLVIANVTEDGSLNMEMIVANGRGYVPANENKLQLEDEKIGFIPIDAMYLPVERVYYDVEDARVGQKANYDKLILNVTTNGALRPEEAVALAAKIVNEHMVILTELNQIADATGVMTSKKEDKQQLKKEKPVEDLNLTPRAENCLKKAEIYNLGDLVEKQESEIKKIRNLGQKSFQEIVEKVKNEGLEFAEEE